MKKILSTIMMAALLLPVFAEGETKEAKIAAGAPQTMMLIGTVVDQVTGEALPGVQVKISGTDKPVYTDLDGNFEVCDIKPGTYNLDISLVSYEDNNIQNLVIGSDMKSAVKVELKR